MDCSTPLSSVYRDSPGKSTGVGCHGLLQGIFPTQGSNPGLPHFRRNLYGLNHRGSPRKPLITFNLNPSPIQHGNLWTLSQLFSPYRRNKDLSFFDPPLTHIDFLGGSDGKASVYNAGGLGSIPGWGRSPGKGNGNPLQYCCMENPMDGGAQWATVHGVTKSQTQLSNFTYIHSTHSCTVGICNHVVNQKIYLSLLESKQLLYFWNFLLQKNSAWGSGLQGNCVRHILSLELFPGSGVLRQLVVSTLSSAFSPHACFTQTLLHLFLIWGKVMTPCHPFDFTTFMTP